MNEQRQFFERFGSVLAATNAALESMDAIRRVAMARGYDQWQDSDLAAAGKTRNDLLALLYLADDTRRFVTGGAVEAGNRQAVIDRYRGDL